MESYSGHNDAMALGMFDAIWPGLSTNGLMQKYNDALTPLSPTFELGQILDQGLYRMSETFGAGSAGQIGKKHTYKIFHCFGDPSMMIYTEKPTNFTNGFILYVLSFVIFTYIRHIVMLVNTYC